MKKILFNLLCAQPSYGSKYHGGGEYVKTVFEFIIKNYHKRSCIVAVFLDDKRFLDQWIWELIEEYDVKIFQLEKEEQCVDIINKYEFDVFYTGMSFVYDKSLIQKEVKTICTVHDLRNYEEATDIYSYAYYDKMKEKIKQVGKNVLLNYIRRRNLLQYYKRLAVYDVFICVSEHTRYMIKSALPEFGERANSVFYTPPKHFQDIKKPENFSEKEYILIVSANRWLKNCYRALKALDDLYEKKLICAKTVLTGGVSKSILKKIKNKDKFIVFQYVDSNELEYLYSQCKVLLYPSLNEGFGMPPLEAMRYGKTCVVSGICSLLELYGGAAYFTNPYKIEEIGNRVLMALENPIDTEIVLKRFKMISERQKNDLKKLAKVIIE